MRLAGGKTIKERKPPMKEDRNIPVPGQGIFFDSAESLREHLRGSVRDSLKAIFEQEIRSLCADRYNPEGKECRRVGTGPAYVMTDARLEPMNRPRVRRARGTHSETIFGD